MRVNNQRVPVYRLDTRTSVLARIAHYLGTEVLYLYFPRGEPDIFRDKDDIEVVDLFRFIVNKAGSSMDIGKFWTEDFRKQIEGKISAQKAGEIWLVYNSEVEKLYRDSPVILTQIAEKLVESGLFSTVYDVEQTWRDREKLKREWRAQLDLSAALVRHTEQLYQRFEQIDDGYVFTNFRTEKITLGFKMKETDMTLLELFNSVRVRDFCPLAICQDYYKLLISYTPEESWLNLANYNPDTLILKVNSRPNVDVQRWQDFTDVTLKIEDVVKGTVKINTERGFLNQTQFLQRVAEVFTTEMKIDLNDTVEEEVAGTFMFPEQRLNSYVFSDLVMNNKLFSTVANIDESAKTTKKHGEGGQPWLYVHFDHPLTGHLTASISERIAEHNDPLLKDEDPEIFPIGKPYIRVRVKAKNVEMIKVFQDLLSRFMRIYDEEYNAIVEYYRRFIPDFGYVRDVVVQPRKDRPDAIMRNVFPTNYSRTCGDNRIPQVVTEKEAEKYAKEGREVMVFPRRSAPDGAPAYPSDGLDCRYYVCLHEEHPFPGLQENKLANSEQYPYLPCCFKSSQRDKEGGFYQFYYEGKTLVQKTKKQQDLIITEKILDVDQFGVLPENLEKLFRLLDPDTNYRYIRSGVSRTTSSFLEAVMNALDEKTNISSLTDADERLAHLLETRLKMSRNEAPVAKQSCYDQSMAEIESAIADPQKYLDPKLFIQVLEQYFQCAIFLFSSQGFILPRSTQGYYTWAMANRPCIFIYEHWGSESDRARFPQCELITRWNTSKSKDYTQLYSRDQVITTGITRAFNTVNKSYQLTRPIVPIKWPFDDSITIIGQTIDRYGKCRQLAVKYENQAIVLLTDPLPPLPILGQIPKEKPKLKIIMEFVQEVKGKVLLQLTDNNNLVHAVEVRISNFRAVIPCQSSALLEGYRSEKRRDVPSLSATSESKLEQYHTNRKLARYISEYSFWLFSKYLQKEKVDKITDKVLKRFAEKKLVVDPDFSYGAIPKTFSTRSGVMKDGQLVVKSEEMLKRLMYVVKLFSIQNLTQLTDYHQRDSIRNYYVDIHDFTRHPDELILQGEEMIEKWLQERHHEFRLYDGIHIGSAPYFFSNPLLGKEIYLAQNCDDVQKALAITTIWEEQHYNPNIHLPIFMGNYQFTLYSYRSPRHITAYVVKGVAPSDHKVLGYRIDGRAYFTALLPLR